LDFSPLRESKSVPVIVDADWQAGVTEDNHAFRPFFNDEPVPGAIAARVSNGRDMGWVDVTAGVGHKGVDREFGIGQYEVEALLRGDRDGIARHHGRVKLQPVRHE